MADRWFVSVLVDRPREAPAGAPNGPVVGIDLGPKTFAMLSTGEAVEGPQAAGCVAPEAPA